MRSSQRVPPAESVAGTGAGVLGVDRLAGVVASAHRARAPGGGEELLIPERVDEARKVDFGG